MEINGYFITFTSEEENDLMETLEEYGYSKDKDGIKNYILDSIYDNDDDSENKTNNIENFLKNNPEIVKGMQNLTGNIIDKVLKKPPFKGRF